MSLLKYLVGAFCVVAVLGVLSALISTSPSYRATHEGPVVGGVETVAAYRSCGADPDKGGMTVLPRFFQRADVASTSEGEALRVMYCLFGRPKLAHLNEVYREVRSHRYGDRIAAETHSSLRPALEYRMYRTLARLWGLTPQLVGGPDIVPRTAPLVFGPEEHRRYLQRAGVRSIEMALGRSGFVIDLR